MAFINQKLIKKTFSQYLSSGEHLVSIGVFKKIPSTGCLLLTKGMAWFFSDEFYVAVTDQRLIILPASRKKSLRETGEEVIFADFDQVEFKTDPLNNPVLDVQKLYGGNPLNLRFKSGFQFEGMDQFDFIAAVKQGKGPGPVGVTS